MTSSQVNKNDTESFKIDQINSPNTMLVDDLEAGHLQAQWWPILGPG